MTLAKLFVILTITHCLVELWNIVHLYNDLYYTASSKQTSFVWVFPNLSVNCTSIVTSDRRGTVPAAGLMVNSTGRAWRSLVALTCQLFLDTSNSCLSEVTLGEPMPSPKTRRPKVMGTKESLEMEQVIVLGKPAKRDEDDKYVTNENIKRCCSGRHCSMKVVILSSIKNVM